MEDLLSFLQTFWKFFFFFFVKVVRLLGQVKRSLGWQTLYSLTDTFSQLATQRIQTVLELMDVGVEIKIREWDPHLVSQVPNAKNYGPQCLRQQGKLI